MDVPGVMMRVEHFSFLAAFIFLILLAVCLALFWFYWAFVRPYKLFPNEALEYFILIKLITRSFPTDIPITAYTFQQILKFCKGYLNEGCCILRMFRPYFVIFDEDMMKVFCNHPAVADKTKGYDVVKDIFGNGLLGSIEETRRVHRKLLNPAFSGGQLVGKMPIINEKAASLVTKLQTVVNTPTEEVEDFILDCTFNIMAESILGLNSSDEKFGSKVKKYRHQLHRAYDFMLSRLTYPWLNWKFLLPFLPDGKIYLKDLSELRGFVSEVIDEMIKAENSPIKEKRNGNENRKSIAHILLKHHLVDGALTLEDLSDHVSNFITAGFDTTAWTFVWCFYTLGHNPEVQERVINEINSVVTRENVRYQDLGKLKYLGCVIKETLRLYSTIPFYGRKLSKEIKYGKYIVPKGTEILFFSYLLHRNPNIYPDPEKFDPDRFSDDSDKHPWALIPFAEGYRNCIGKKLAMMELKVVLVHVLRNFKITCLTKIEDSDFDWKIVLKTIKPLRFLLTNRK